VRDPPKAQKKKLDLAAFRKVLLATVERAISLVDVKERGEIRGGDSGQTATNLRDLPSGRI